MNTTEGDWRDEIEQRLGRYLTDGQWQLIADAFLEELLLGSAHASEVMEFIRQHDAWMAAASDKPREVVFITDDQPEKQGRASEYWERQRAISMVCAAEANQNKHVIAFRERYLADGLVDWRDIEDWMTARAEEEGAPTRYVNDLPLPPGTVVKGSLRAAYLEPPITISEDTPAFFGWSVKTVSYHRQESKWPIRIPVVHDGALNHLRTVAEQLHRRYGWPEAAASTFIVCGVEPVIPAVRVRYSLKHLIPALSRITLEIDPAVAPRDLLQYYRDARQELVRGRRYRPMSRRSLEQAITFVERDDAESWGETMARWNESNEGEDSEWQYDDAERFGHDCRIAIRTLMNPSFLDGDPQAALLGFDKRSS